MARACSICQHLQRDAIERAILSGEPIRRIAARYNVSESALRRHRNKHFAEVLRQSKEAAEMARAEKLAEFILFVRNEALSVYKEARKGKRLRIALEALGLGLTATSVLGKLVGEMGERIEVKLTESKDWLELQRVILEALDPFPEARQVLSRALYEYGGKDGGDQTR